MAAEVWTLMVECPVCEGRVRAHECERYLYDTADYAGAADYHQVSFLRCPECSQPFVARIDSNDFTGSDADQPAMWKVVYPTQAAPLRGVPESISHGYNEAMLCSRVGAWTAAAVMCRRMLEAVCQDKGTTSRNLATNLKQLEASGVIDSRLYEWSDELRVIGNDAAHKVDEVVSKEDAKESIEFARAIIEYVYTFTDAFENFKKRRAVRKQIAEERRSGKNGAKTASPIAVADADSDSSSADPQPAS